MFFSGSVIISANFKKKSYPYVDESVDYFYADISREMQIELFDSLYKCFKGASLGLFCSEGVFVCKKDIYYSFYLLIHIGIMQCETYILLFMCVVFVR